MTLSRLWGDYNMKYYDKLIFELSNEGSIGYSLPKDDFSDISVDLDSSLLRNDIDQLKL